MTTLQKEKATRYNYPQFDVFISGDGSEGKLLVTVSKKVAARAVDRNRIRRIIKQAIKNTRLQKKAVKFIVRVNIYNLKTQDILNIIKNLNP